MQNLPVLRANWRESRATGTVRRLLSFTTTMTIRAAFSHILVSLPLASMPALSACATAADGGHERLPGLELPTCGPDQAHLAGAVDGDKVEASGIVVGRDFADAEWTSGGFLDVELASGDHISIGWDEPLRDGVAAGAAGVLDRPAGDVTYTSCVHDAVSGLVQLDPDGTIYFDLDDMSRDGLCDGPIAGGEIAGCVGPAVTPDLTPLAAE